MDYSNFNKKFYNDSFKKGLSDKAGSTGWQTTIPSKDLFLFIEFLKSKNITGKVLDIGCGGGRHSFEFSKAGFETYGLDFSETAIEIAKEKSKEMNLKIDLKVGSVLSIKYDNDFFDVINDDGCLHHISPEDQILYKNNVLRVMKKGGIYRVKAFSKNCNFFNGNKGKEEGNRILVPEYDYTYFFEGNEFGKIFGDEFEILSIEEKGHNHTVDKAFRFVLLQKK